MSVWEWGYNNHVITGESYFLFGEKDSLLGTSVYLPSHEDAIGTLQFLVGKVIWIEGLQELCKRRELPPVFLVHLLWCIPLPGQEGVPPANYLSLKECAEVTFWWYFLTRLPRRPLGLKWAPFRTDTASHTRAPAPLTLRKRREEEEGSWRRGVWDPEGERGGREAVEEGGYVWEGRRRKKGERVKENVIVP